MTENETTGEKRSRGMLWCLLWVLGLSRRVFLFCFVLQDESCSPSVSAFGNDPVAGCY